MRQTMQINKTKYFQLRKHLNLIVKIIQSNNDQTFLL